MPAPKDTQWSNVISNNKGSSKLGIKVWIEDLGTKVKEHMEVWYWSQYSVYDEINEFFISVWGEEFWSIGSILINHTSNTSWSESNQTLIGSWTGTHTKYENARNGNASVKFTGIEYGGGSGSFVVTFNVSALTTYTISYHANGGSNAPSSQTKWHGSALTLTSSVPTRTGYTFLGWGTSASDTTVDYNPSSTYGTDANITLYAIWKANTYEVWFNANGGEYGVNGLTKVHDTPLPLPTTIPTRTNYNFLGWNTYASATDVMYEAGDTYTANSSTTLYAIWELAYTKPRVMILSLFRCDEQGNALEDGTCAKIKFYWETDEETSSYAIYYTDKSTAMQTKIGSVYLGGTDGYVETIIKDGDTPVYFDTDKVYEIQLNVADAKGYNTAFATLNSIFLLIDTPENRKSISFGKPCPEGEGYFGVKFPHCDFETECFSINGIPIYDENIIYEGKTLANTDFSVDLPNYYDIRKGLVFVFSRDGDYNFSSHFVPKRCIGERTSFCFMLCTSLFEYIGTKTLYVSTTKVEGYKDNATDGIGTISGISYRNSAFHLRYILEI